MGLFLIQLAVFLWTSQPQHGFLNSFDFIIYFFWKGGKIGTESFQK